KTEVECTALRNARLSTVPIGSSTQPNGAFVMILSTDADAIAGTIGAFAENETVVGSAMYLATRSARGDAAAIAARATTVKSSRKAAAAELSSLFQSAESATPATAKDVYLAILKATAAGIAPDAAPAFKDVAEAQAWFAARPRSAAQ
ncbi:MAG TPA: hypothetical protein VEW26_15800, partial [Allosphingosinicella sp.]|nr:hypothetical protein [Allosphingosinicella sp.]